MRVDDEYEQATQAFTSKFPTIKGVVAKSLMQLEKRR